MDSTQISASHAEFLTSPAKKITVNRINFTAANLPEYEGLYAVVINGVLTTNECNALIRGAEASSVRGWEQATINIGEGQERLLTEERDCSRIIWDSPQIAERIWDRIEHIAQVREIVRLENAPLIVGQEPTKLGEVWKLSRPNEELRFLKYTPGQYFRPHCDGSYAKHYISDDEGRCEERAYLTLHLYLNDASVTDLGQSGTSHTQGASYRDVPLRDGSTRFYSPVCDLGRYVDVEPKAGRILLFQHRDLVHSGEEVVQGEKYTIRADLMYYLESSESGQRSFMPTL